MTKGKPLKKKLSKSAKKKFFEVEIPNVSTKVHLYGYSPDSFEDKVIKLDLSKSLRGKNLELRAKIKFNNEKLSTEIISLELNKNYIKKVMRKGTDYVEDSIKTDCKDSELQIKPFMITRKRVSHNVRKALREQTLKFIKARTTTRNTQEILTEIITNKFQKELSLKLKKVYPLALCEIRAINVLKRKSPEETKAEKKETPKSKSKPELETPTPSSK